MHLALFLVSSLCLSAVSAQSKYPFIMWSEEAFKLSTESSHSMSINNVVEILKAVAEGTHASNVIVIAKEGLTTQELVEEASAFDFLKTKIITQS